MGWKTKEDQKNYNYQYYKNKHEKILEQKREYRLKNLDRIKNYQKKHYEANKKKCKNQAIEYYSVPENRMKKILSRTKERARDLGLAFDLELSDLIPEEYCCYLKIKLTYDLGNGQQLTNPSIDRIDNTKGYIKGNVRIISRLANNMKSSSTRLEREEFAKAILSDSSL